MSSRNRDILWGNEIQGDYVNGDKVEGDKVEGNQYIFNIDTQEEDMGIIEDIFTGVLKTRGTIIKQDDNKRLIKLPRKIEINFSIEERVFVNRYFQRAYEYISLIQVVLEQFDAYDQQDIQEDIEDRYMRYKASGVNSFLIMTNLFDDYLPKNKKTDPKYRKIARAIVLFFFEDCTWGEKIEEEL